MKIKINFGKGDKEVKKEFSLDFNSIAKKVATSAANVAKKVETFIENTEETANEMYENAENDTSNAKEPIEDIFEHVENCDSRTEKQFSENKDDITRKAEEHAQKIIEKADNILKKAEECAEQVFSKVDEFTKKAEEHAKNVLEKADQFAQKVKEDAKQVLETEDSVKCDENDSVSDEGKDDSEEVTQDNETLVDGDDYPDEVDETEAAKVALKNKISQIPEGKTFTLAQYLDYTEEGNCIKDTSVFDYRSEIFLDAIKFPWSPEALEAFSYVANLKKPSYEVLSKKLSAKYNRDVVKELKKDFEAWLKRRPDVNKYCPKANLWHLLLYYRKKVNEAINK